MVTGRPRWAPRRALVLLVALLAVLNVCRSIVVPGGWHLAFNLTTAAVAVGVAALGGVGAAGLGLGRDRWVAGARLGGAAFLAITLVVTVGALVGVVADDDVSGDRNEVLARALVLIPVGTVLVEELVFRGALDGLLRASLDDARVIAVSSAVLFGLWHVVPAWRGGSSGLDGLGSGWQVLLTFGATTVAGLGFHWLRARSGSLLAPMLAHLATNSSTLLVVWWLA